MMSTPSLHCICICLRIEMYRRVGCVGDAWGCGWELRERLWPCCKGLLQGPTADTTIGTNLHRRRASLGQTDILALDLVSTRRLDDYTRQNVEPLLLDRIAAGTNHSALPCLSFFPSSKDGKGSVRTAAPPPPPPCLLSLVHSIDPLIHRSSPSSPSFPSSCSLYTHTPAHLHTCLLRALCFVCRRVSVSSSLRTLHAASFPDDPAPPFPPPQPFHPHSAPSISKQHHNLRSLLSSFPPIVILPNPNIHLSTQKQQNHNKQQTD
ncbi:hypothetical protein EDD21DRAFT_231168 [Dissophora ornata]|nr:hypothetical protein EDD21DRAFT_231168 [Dissophora ornata]